MPCFQGASINGSPRLLKSRCPEVQLCASPWQEQDEMLGLKGQCDAGTQRPVWQRPSLLLPLGGTAHPFSCCHDKHLPGLCTLAVIPHSIWKSTQRWECHPGAFPGHFVWVPRAEPGTGWCWTGLSGVKLMLYRHGLKKKEFGSISEFKEILEPMGTNSGSSLIISQVQL